jgi:hypothetical protein
MVVRSSCSIINSDRYLFVTTTAEKQFHTNMLPQKEVEHLLLCLINLDIRFSKEIKTVEMYLHQTCLSRNRHRIHP